MPLQIEVSRREIADFCRRNQIRKLAVFGSALREDFTPDSDVDVIVWFEPEARVGLITLGGIERRLSELMGRKVDMHTPEMLSKYFRDRVLAEAQVVYERT
ncbi:MAG: nucleotidyltransferase family protein [Armatimonadota bacterium]|nr:nucleotidyltransferase family protein [Armatimonadota bacterium]